MTETKFPTVEDFKEEGLLAVCHDGSALAITPKCRRRHVEGLMISYLLDEGGVQHMRVICTEEEWNKDFDESILEELYQCCFDYAGEQEQPYIRSAGNEQQNKGTNTNDQ